MQSNQQDSAHEEWVNQLCPKCGLCCNGVLFADVRLTAADSALALENAGLKLQRHRGLVAFQQPCRCFDGSLCTVYPHRPSRCRSFNCHTLQQAVLGQVTLTAALKRIAAAKTKAAEVVALLRMLGNHDELVPLTRRYKAVMQQRVDLSTGPESTERRGELLAAMDDLMRRLQRDFLQVSGRRTK